MKKISTSLRKIRTDNIWKWTTFSFSCLLMLIFVAIIVFIIISAIPGFEKFGLDGILGTLEFNLSGGEASLWSPLSVTLLVTFGAVLFATPIGIKTATFIRFRLKPHQQKWAFIIVQALSGIPSVVFGLFALESLGQVVGMVFGVGDAYNILNAIVMLTFMILPTIITLTLNTYNNIPIDFISNPISLGVTKTRAIYKIFKAKARNGVIVAVIIAIGRAFGETMALSMILSSESYSILSSGISDTLTSSLGTLGSVIATNMFSETGGPAIRGVLYAFGIFLFVIVMILNAVIMYVTNRKKNRSASKFEQVLGNIIMWVPHTISSFFNNLFIDRKYNVNYESNNISKYISERMSNHKLWKARSIWWIFWEYFSVILTFGFLIWICVDIVGVGIVSISNPQYSTAFSYSVNTTGQALLNTLVIIFASLLISIPFSLLIAIYLNEYASNSKVKRSILYFVDCLGSSPSIIFGMFGLAVFIELFGLTLGGGMGKSLIAGALTISIVILPSLTRTTQQALEGVPMSVRESAYSLGCTKWETIWKVVIKQAIRPLASSLILAIGRIMAETAPLYLTAGLTSVSGVGLMLPGQTLTTRIYAQLNSTDLNAFQAISYECAFIALMIILLLIWIGNFVIPNNKQIKEWIVNNYFSIINGFVFSSKNKKVLDLVKKQIIKKTLYLSYEQAKVHDINRRQFKFFFHNKKLYLIKYVKYENLLKINNGEFIKPLFN